jgi:preprotein translocase subunit SecG
MLWPLQFPELIIIVLLTLVVALVVLVLTLKKGSETDFDMGYQSKKRTLWFTTKPRGSSNPKDEADNQKTT